MGWSTTVAATGTTRGSAAMMREAISGLLLANLRGGFATAKSSNACSSHCLTVALPRFTPQESLRIYATPRRDLARMADNAEAIDPEFQQESSMEDDVDTLDRLLSPTNDANSPASVATNADFSTSKKVKATREKEVDHTTRAYNERRREQRIQRQNALRQFEHEAARTAQAEKSKILTQVAASVRRQKVLRGFGSERERREAQLYPTEAALIPVDPIPRVGNPYLPSYVRGSPSSLPSLSLDKPIVGIGGEPTQRPASRSPQRHSPPSRQKLDGQGRPSMLPPAHSRGFGAGGYEGMPMVGTPSKGSTPYWTRT